MLVDAEPLARKSLSDCWAGHFANEQMDDGHIAGYVPVTSCNHAEPQSVDILDLPLAPDWLESVAIRQLQIQLGVCPAHWRRAAKFAFAIFAWGLTFPKEQYSYGLERSCSFIYVLAQAIPNTLKLRKLGFVGMTWIL